MISNSHNFINYLWTKLLVGFFSQYYILNFEKVLNWFDKYLGIEKTLRKLVICLQTQLFI